MSETLEKIVCCPNGNNDMLTAMLSNNGGMGNNPMQWLVWLYAMRWLGNDQNGRNQVQDAEIMGQINSLRDLVNANQNTNNITGILNALNNGQHDAAGAMNCGFANINNSINNASMQNVIGQKDMTAQMASCCCDIKSNILNQTNQLQSQIAQLANGVQTGFAQVGFLTQQQTNELNNNANANTQRILDKMCTAETQSLRDKLAQASQDSQTAQLIAALKTTA